MERGTELETSKNGQQIGRRRTRSSPSLRRSSCPLLQNEKRRNSTSQNVVLTTSSSSRLFGSTRDAISKFTKKHISNKRKQQQQPIYRQYNDTKSYTIDYDINQNIPLILIDEANDIILTDDICYAMYIEQANDAWEIVANIYNNQQLFQHEQKSNIEDYHQTIIDTEEQQFESTTSTSSSEKNEIENCGTPIPVSLTTTAKVRIGKTVDAISTFRTMATKRGDYFVQTLKEYFGTDEST